MPRRHRPLPARVLGDDGVRDPGLDDRVVVGDADDLRAFHQAVAATPDATASTASSKACSAADARLCVDRCRRRSGHRWLTTLVMLATIAATVNLYIKIPKGMFPTGRHRPHLGVDGSLARHLVRADERAAEARRADRARRPGGRRRRRPRSAPRSSRCSRNTGRMFISLKPLDERGGASSQQVIDRLRRPMNSIAGPARVHVPGAGFRHGRAPVEVEIPADAVDARVRRPASPGRRRCSSACVPSPGIEDVTTDREQGGMSVDISIDKQAMARLGVRTSATSTARSTTRSRSARSRSIYTQRNQYRVMLEVDPRLQRDPGQPRRRSSCPGRGGAQVPLTSVVKMTARPRAARGQSPGPVPRHHHQLQSQGRHDARRGAGRRSTQAIADMRLPDSIRAEAGRRRARRAAGRRRAAAADPGRSARGLHRARRALRELRASADHHLDAAVGRPRRAGRAAVARPRILDGRLHRHHSADRHRQEERHHAGRLRARRRAHARPLAARRHLRSLHRALPADPDDDAGGAARRRAAGARVGARRRHCARRSASPSSAACSSARS